MTSCYHEIEPGGSWSFSPALNRNGSIGDHVMAYPIPTTPQVRPHLARINPTWQAAPQPLGMLKPFFGGGDAAPVVSRPAPVRPAPAMEMA
tara:strand:+ start:5365 stop:5637 length:273 start_codon:yes stop_codon:yes gene_type:complete